MNTHPFPHNLLHNRLDRFVGHLDAQSRDCYAVSISHPHLHPLMAQGRSIFIPAHILSGTITAKLCPRRHLR